MRCLRSLWPRLQWPETACRQPLAIELCISKVGLSPSGIRRQCRRPNMHADRRADIEAVIDDLLSSSEFRGVIDMQSIGAAGHSLGAYTVVGMVGGWSSWLDPPQGRISSLTNTSQFRARRIRIQTAGQ